MQVQVLPPLPLWRIHSGGRPMAKAQWEKTLDEFAQDMHTRADGCVDGFKLPPKEMH